MKKSILTFISFLILMLLISCGSSTGTLNGTVTGLDGSTPISNAQIILCQRYDGTDEHLICTLKGEPSTTTGVDGNFELPDIPTGTYIVMVGLPGQLEMSPSEWDGIPVTRGDFCMEAGHNSVCDIDGVEPSPFWSEGAFEVGEVIMAFKYQEDEEQPGVVIMAGADEGATAADMHIYMGTIHSIYTGISANVLAGQYIPQVEITSGDNETVTIEMPIDYY